MKTRYHDFRGVDCVSLSDGLANEDFGTLPICEVLKLLSNVQ